MKSIGVIIVFVILILGHLNTVYAAPSIVLNPVSGPVGTVVAVLGSGFATSNTACVVLIASGWGLTTESCAITNGTVTGSFTVPAEDPIGSYTVYVTAAPNGDSGVSIFLITGGTTTQQTSTTATSQTTSSTQSSTAASATSTTSSLAISSTQVVTVSTVTSSTLQVPSVVTNFLSWLRCFIVGLLGGTC